MAEAQIQNKSLSIRVCSNGLSFCTFAPGREDPFEYKAADVNHTISLTANLKQALLNEPMLKQDYQRVNVLVATPHFTIVPVASFAKEDIQDYYNFVFPKTKPLYVSYNVLRRSGIAIVFGLERSVHQLLIDDFPRARFYAAASTLIESFAEKSMIGPGRKMYVYLHEKDMNLYAFGQGKMLFVNTFEASSISDIQYYTLHVWKELGFDQVDDQLFVVGDTEKRPKELAEKMKYFLQNAHTIDRNEDFKEQTPTGHTPLPYDLQTLLVCGF